MAQNWAVAIASSAALEICCFFDLKKALTKLKPADISTPNANVRTKEEVPSTPTGHQASTMDCTLREVGRETVPEDFVF